MKYKCANLTYRNTPCRCEYRELSPGQWEYRYADREWSPISAKSIADIEEFGHRLMKDATRAQDIRDEVADMVSNLMYYDRKEDERLPVGAIEAAIEQGEITVDEIVELIRQQLS